MSFFTLTQTNVHCISALHNDPVAPPCLCGLVQKILWREVAKFHLFLESMLVLICLEVVEKFLYGG